MAVVAAMGTTIIFLSSCGCLYLLLLFINFFNKAWWTPIRIQSALHSQGVKGPSYRFLHGNLKEIINLRKEAMSSPTELCHQSFSRIQPHVYLWSKLHGKNFFWWKGSQAQLVVYETEQIKVVLNNKDGNYLKPEVQPYLKKLFGDGLVTTRGEKWFKLRKVANHAFHGESLKDMIPEMVSSVEMMLGRWKDHRGKEIEVFQDFKVLTSEIISRTAFGSSYLEGQQIFEILTRMVFIFSKNLFKMRIPGIGKLVKTQDDIQSEKLGQLIRNSVIKMIKKREAAMAGEIDGYGSDFLGQLVKVYRSADMTSRITIDDLIDECKNFYIAGHETTTSALTWIVLMLATHADWQEKVRNEILELFGQQNPSLEGISRLKTMSMVINESLRLYPPVVGLLREVRKGTKLGNLIIPEKMEVHVPSLALHHDPQIWGDDVHLFKPDRFAEGVAKATKNNISAFLPFGMGPRNCLGMNFAYNEIKITLSMVLQRYKITLSPNYVHSPVLVLAICPRHGLQVMIKAV
ncbi:cytochrome P450 CYP749A22-like [Populus nigra]|uniref:cytochrome P450 CYP749A22-like n=1 Tax=Populus nigra TaxID=3691 RepID=UPI002B26E0D5|nr:cytochrome P450 CYP749A22-like [Populus nigra]